jgi:hypothetical protein
MALHTVLTVEVQPGAIARYTAAIERLAEAARKKKDPFRWGAFRTLFGERMTLHFVSTAENYKALGARGTVPELVARVLGANEAPRFLEEVGGAVVAQRLTVSIDRPDLSYLRGPLPAGSLRAASVSRIAIRLGAREAFEELARKLAEAIPKVDDPAQLITRQVIIGNAAEYTLIRPLGELSDLDAQRSPEQLLVQAFGAAEGGLIFRNGGEAIEQIQREIVGLVEPLSNPVA